MKSFLIILLISALAGATVLGDAAASMEPGTWKTIDIGLTPDLYRQYGDIFVYCNDAIWDPNTEQLLFMNRYHGKPWEFIIYDSDANQWHKSTALQLGSHTYDDLTMNRDDGYMYYFQADGVMRRFSPVTEEWEVLDQYGTKPPYPGHGMATEYFPEMNALINVKGANYFDRVSKYDLTTKAWSCLAKTDSIAMGGVHVLAEYSPVHKCILFGGGNPTDYHAGDESRYLYILDASGKTRKIKNAPTAVGIQQGLLTCDPVTGDFLVLGSDNLYSYSPVSDEWTNLGSNPGLDRYYWAVAPISTYGVVLFMCGYGCSISTKVTLYKHAEPATSKLEAGSAGRNKTTLQVFPNPFKQDIRIGLPSGGQARLSVYNSAGKLVKRAPAGSSGEFVWRPQDAPAGIYFIRLETKGRTFHKRVLYQE